MIGHVQCHNSRQNSSILSSIYSDDPVISSSFIRHIFIEIVADIDNGPERSVEIVPWGNMTKKGSGCGISRGTTTPCCQAWSEQNKYSTLVGLFLVLGIGGKVNPG